MKHVILIISLFISLTVLAQEPTKDIRPHRTPEEIAHKQTEMLSRELNLTDSLQRARLYELHLKYVHMRIQGNTRAQELERMQSFYNELQSILSAEQYHVFMNKQVAPGPRQQRERGPVMCTSTAPK